jgi:hypothetical protein
MSLQHAALETGLIYQVVGTRATGQHVTISHHFDLAVAEEVLSLMESTGDYIDMFIECDGERLPAHRE